MKIVELRTRCTLLAIVAVAIAGVAMAQTPADPRMRAAQPASATIAKPSATPAGSQSDGVAPSDDGGETGPSLPVMLVTSVEVMRSSHPPELDVIRVRGLSSSDAWGNPELAPLTRAPSADGMLDLLFVGRAPTEAINAAGYGSLEAIFVVEPGHPYKGVRVRGALNSVSVKGMPGYTEVAGPKADCQNCIGKWFVAKGAAAPTGKSAVEVVREDDLPGIVRVIRASDGVATFDINPNRLTLVLGDDGRVVLAVWD